MLKKLILLFFFLSNIVLFSQNNFSLDSLLTKEKVNSYLLYHIDISKKETLETIDEKVFSSYKNKNFLGKYGQKIWFKLDLSKSKNLDEDFFFLLNTVSIKKLILYQDTKSGYKEQFTFQKNGELSIQIPIDFSGTTNYLFEVIFTEAVFFPIEISSKQNLDNLHKKNLVIYGLYYGFVLIVLIINLFFYKQTKERFFLYYIFLVIGITLIILELDGVVNLLFGNVSWILSLDTILDAFLLISAMLFTTEALRVNEFLPRVKWIGIILVLGNIFSSLIYLLTDVFIWYSLGEFFNLLGLFFYWLIVIWFVKKMVFARFMFIAYTALYLTNVFYVLPPQLGMMDFGLGISAFKIGSAIEMLVFLYAISYRHKSIRKEKEILTLELESHKRQLLDKNIELETSVEEKFTNFKNKYNLTSRELENLTLIIQGKKNKEIAKELYVTEATIKYHCSKLYQKMGVKNRSQLIALFNSNT